MTGSARKWLLVVVVTVLLGLAALYWSSTQPAARPNVLVITIDTLRADHIGAYGDVAAQTPTLDALAREGLLFAEAYSSAPITLPSHSTIMSGLLPPAHGVRDNGAYALPDSAITLAERLKAVGYSTQAFVSAVVLAKRYNLTQGFDDYDDKLWDEDDPKLFMIRERRAADTIDASLAWFERWKAVPQQRPFFTWVHLFDPHQPHQAPGWISATSTSSYDAEITYADQELGRLIEALRAAGQLDNTLIVLTADHGESLGEHGEKTHAVFVYRATMHVPLILHYPRRFAAGQRVSTPVHHVDLVPTVLATLGLTADPTLPGLDLAGVASGKLVADRPLYSESLLAEVGFGMAPLFAVRESGHTFIRAPRPELYDLSTDPNEINNLIETPANRQIADGMDISLQQVLDAAQKQALTTPRNPLSEESVEMLQSLGYLQGANERAGVAGMDPKDGIVIYNKLEAARKAAQNGSWQDSEKIAREILAEVPAHASARGVLATALMNLGRDDEARDEYLKLIAQNPGEFRVHGLLGSMALRNGDLDLAEQHYKDALSAAPKFIEAMSGMGLLAMLRDDEAGARKWFDQIVAIDPDFPDARRLLGDWYFQRGEFANAREAYGKALKIMAEDYRTLIQAAASARRSDAMPDARQLLQQAIELRPNRWVGHYNLACLDAVEGRRPEALANLRAAVELEPDTIGLAGIDTDLATLRGTPEYAELQALAAKGTAIPRHAAKPH